MIEIFAKIKKAAQWPLLILCDLQDV